MIQSWKARTYRKKCSKGWWDRRFGSGRHNYEVAPLDYEIPADTVEETDAYKLDDEKENGYGEKGIFNTPFGYSNVAILHSQYKGVATKTLDEATSRDSNGKILIYKIYVEGSGANDINDNWTGWATNGLGFGLGKTGVVALVSKAVAAVDARLAMFKGNTNVEVHFDIFGFSRGSACARLFAYLVRRDKDERLVKREYEFSKYYCKNLFNNKEGKLDFLTEYVYDGADKKCEEKNRNGSKTKKVDFLGIYDTVVSIGLLRRKRSKTEIANSKELLDRIENKYPEIKEFIEKLNEQMDSSAIEETFMQIKPSIDKLIDNYRNSCINLNNIINPLRIFFTLNKDFWGNLHDLNVDEYGMYSPTLGIDTFQICAMDEFRENFALTDLGADVPSNCLEIFLPGCHSDIGGGYLCNTKERIILNKFSLMGLDNVLTKPEKSHASVFTHNPQSLQNATIQKLSIKTMQNLGWLPNRDDKNLINRHETVLGHQNVTSVYKDGEKGVCMEGTQTVEGQSRKGLNEKGLFGNTKKQYGKGQYEWWESKARLEWKRTVPYFFSNVPLHLMAEKAQIVTGRPLFTGDENKIWRDKFYEVPKGLEDIYDKARRIIDKKGKRFFIFPGEPGNYSSDEYKKIRLNYLHFTSEQKLGLSRLWNVQNETDISNAGINAENVVCRIVYHGNREDKGNMHYMYDYGEYAE